jgi:polyisoprenoid-binding protein YceI
MKRALTICGLFCALMIVVASVSAQKGANFAGTWELDKAKSTLAGPVAESIKSATWIVTHDDKQLAREQKIERIEGAGGRGLGLGGPLTVKLDGSETTTESQRGKTVSKAKWLNEGKTLEISASSTFSGQNGELTVTTTEHWELADEGKTLKVHRKTEGLRSPSESTWVLTKK